MHEKQRKSALNYEDRESPRIVRKAHIPTKKPHFRGFRVLIQVIWLGLEQKK